MDDSEPAPVDVSLVYLASVLARRGTGQPSSIAGANHNIPAVRAVRPSGPQPSPRSVGRMPRRPPRTAMDDKEDPAFEWHRRVGPDPRDPRLEGGPCDGAHQPLRRQANDKAAYYHWPRCKLRMMLYIPKQGFSGRYRAAGLLPVDAGAEPWEPDPVPNEHGAQFTAPVPEPAPKQEQKAKRTRMAPRTSATSPPTSATSPPAPSATPTPTSKARPATPKAKPLAGPQPQPEARRPAQPATKAAPRPSHPPPRATERHDIGTPTELTEAELARRLAEAEVALARAEAKAATAQLQAVLAAGRAAEQREEKEQTEAQVEEDSESDLIIPEGFAELESHAHDLYDHFYAVHAASVRDSSYWHFEEPDNSRLTDGAGSSRRHR